MKRLLLVILFILSSQSSAQTLQVSNPFLSSGFYDFGILDPFQRCNNSIITANGLSCQVQNNQQKIQVTLPTSFLITNSVVPVDVRIIKDSQPIPGSSLSFDIVRNGSNLSSNSVQTFQPNISENLNVVVNIWLFGINATNQQTGDLNLEIIIP